MESLVVRTVRIAKHMTVQRPCKRRLASNWPLGNDKGVWLDHAARRSTSFPIPDQPRLDQLCRGRIQHRLPWILIRHQRFDGVAAYSWGAFALWRGLLPDEVAREIVLRS